jgi:general secretion pathway protein K
VEELYRVRGFDARAVARLRPYVTALPERTKVNANTAPEPVLAAILPDVSPERMAALVSMRRKQPLPHANAIAELLQPKAGDTAIDTFLDVKSRWFQVGVLVVQEDVHVAGDALVERKPDGAATVMIWRRPRF